MNFKLLVTLLFAFLCAAELATRENGVYVLNEANFDEWLNQAPKYVLVEFYAPWCGHCKQLAPEYEAAAQALEAKNLDVALAKVNVEDNQAIGSRFQIRGFPTLNWFAGNVVVDYKGGRTRSAIVSWIENQIKENLDVLATSEALKTAISSNNAAVIVYGESAKAADLLELAKNVADIAAFQVTDASLFGDNKSGDIVVYSSNKAPSTVTGENLEDEIYKVIYPPVVIFTNEQFQRLMKKGMVILVVGSFEEDGGQSLVNLLTPLAEKFPSAGYLVGDSALLARGVTSIGASGNFFPTAISLNFADDTQAAFNEEIEFNVANLEKFIADSIAGTVVTYQKSEPIPENSDKGSVVLVAKNFDKYVGAGTPAFVKYYAPWCGHCKNLEPVWHQLGDLFEQSQVYIAKIDATANYVAAPIQGYPTLIWYNANGEGEAYDGERDLQTLQNFVNSKLAPATQPHKHEHGEL